MPYKHNEDRQKYLLRYRAENKQKISEGKRKYYLKNRIKILQDSKDQSDKRRNRELFKLYGITLDQYNILLAKQNEVCAICQKPETRPTSKNLVVDHCHKTGRVRGLLCSACNAAIGLLKEDLNIINNCVGYLTEGKSNG